MPIMPRFRAVLCRKTGIFWGPPFRIYSRKKNFFFFFPFFRAKKKNFRAVTCRKHPLTLLNWMSKIAFFSHQKFAKIAFFAFFAKTALFHEMLKNGDFTHFCDFHKKCENSVFFKTSFSPHFCKKWGENRGFEKPEFEPHFCVF